MSPPTPRKSARPKGNKDSFKSVARDLECDESEAAFDKALGKIGAASVPRMPAKRKRSPKIKIALSGA